MILTMRRHVRECRRGERKLERDCFPFTLTGCGWVDSVDRDRLVEKPNNMKLLLWLLGFFLCLAPTIFTLTTYPFSLYKHYGGITETEFDFTPTHTLSFILSSLLVFPYLYFTRQDSVRFVVTLRKTKKETYTPLIVLIFFMGLFASYIFALLGRPVPTQFVPMFEATPVALGLILMGVFGVFLMANSFKHLNPKRRKAWVHLILGFFMVVLAFIYLELLLRYTWI